VPPSWVVDIVHAVKFARANDLLVAVRSGGHNVAGRALCDDCIVIDLIVEQGNRMQSPLSHIVIQFFGGVCSAASRI
jgi:FAD/FMN-containing dehydrogenase